MNGKGVFKWKTGRYYKGEYKDDLKHGYGELYSINGKVYKGNWDNGK